MSGGSLDYFYYKVEDMAGQILGRAENPLQKAFAMHLFDVAEALKDLEWHYSADTRDPEPDTIKKIIDNKTVLDVATSDAEKVLEDLKTIIDWIKNAPQK